MEKKIVVLQIKSNNGEVVPDFIYNRADLYSDNYICLLVQGQRRDYQIYVTFYNDHAELCAWLMEVCGTDIDEISKFLFGRYPEIEYISFYNLISDRTYVAKNHYHIMLPSSYEELEKRLTSKSRYNMSRMLKKAESEYGSVNFIEYENNQIVDSLILNYFRLKEMTSKIQYKLTCNEYVKKYHISHAYVLYFGEKIAAILLTCEQCPIVYLENLTYDIEFSKYSPGMIAYDMLLARLISKRKKSIYLSGGDYSYKKKYGSIETFVTEGKVYRSFVLKLKYKFIDSYYKHLYWKLKELKEKCLFVINN